MNALAPRVAALGALLLFASSAASPAAGQSAGRIRENIDVSKIGPQVGERVPDFNLKDQNGRARTLRSIMGPRGALVVFIRSADW